MSELTGWDGWGVSAVIFKLGFYGVASLCIGALLCCCLIQQSSRSDLTKQLALYALWAAAGGLMMTALQFLQQVGAFNEAGIAGVFDPEIGQMLLFSNVGLASAVRCLAFLLLLVCAWRLSDDLKSRYWLPAVISALVMFGYSFSVIGHVTELNYLAGIAITLHVITALWWLGSLIPLLTLSKELRIEATQQLMIKFGQLAAVMIAGLIIGGGWLAVELLGSLDQALFTDYGRLLLLKLTLAIIMLSLGALNKLRLVPHLTEAGGLKKLQQAIKLELMLGIIIVSITSVATTLVGPS